MAVAAFETDHEAGHQPEDIREIARTRGLDELPVDDRDRGGRLVERLRQAAGTEYYRQLGIELLFRQQVRLGGRHRERRCPQQPQAGLPGNR
jgi:hypothetical protein